MNLQDFYDFIFVDNARCLDLFSLDFTHPLVELYLKLYASTQGSNFEFSDPEFIEIQSVFEKHFMSIRGTEYCYTTSNNNPINQLFIDLAQRWLIKEPCFYLSRPSDITNQLIETDLHILMPGLQSYVCADGLTPLSLGGEQNLIFMTIQKQDHVFLVADILNMIKAQNRVVYPFDANLPMATEHFEQFVLKLSKNEREALSFQLIKDNLAYSTQLLLINVAIQVIEQICAVLRDGNVSDEMIWEAVSTCVTVLDPIVDPIKNAIFCNRKLGQVSDFTSQTMLSLFKETLAGQRADTAEHCFGTYISALLYSLKSVTEASGYLNKIPEVLKKPKTRRFDLFADGSPAPRPFDSGSNHQAAPANA